MDFFEMGRQGLYPAHLLKKLDKRLVQAAWQAVLTILLQKAQKPQQGTAVKHIVRWERRI
ncbi:hypothetical protein [uncultured Mailhella sp.]|uniref:hypothetical protein n=1 Tax=uncultured Mailhella sp. TaxID=1981031 RepID=UPI002617F52B|nr:hypothetical protein [uncultured Mailhella sp.]